MLRSVCSFMSHGMQEHIIRCHSYRVQFESIVVCKLEGKEGRATQNAELLESFVMPTKFSLFTRYQKQHGERPLEHTVLCTVICARGCRTAFLGKAQASRVVENEVVYIG
jgi:predicted metal-binding protein